METWGNYIIAFSAIIAIISAVMFGVDCFVEHRKKRDRAIRIKAYLDMHRHKAGRNLT